jgi:hypothetical protein
MLALWRCRTARPAKFNQFSNLAKQPSTAAAVAVAVVGERIDDNVTARVAVESTPERLPHML